jgi:two-component system phosphate regulon sensor histidine kinase PhoR
VLELSGTRNGQAGWLLLAIDVTDARRVEQMRRDFVGNVAHELKTPLTVIAGFNETLRDINDLTENERMEITQHIQTQTHSMRRLVDDLLSLSRLENADEIAEQSPIAVSDCLKRVVQAAQFSASEHAPIEIHIPETILLLGEEEEIESALLNLLTNAVRYTPASGTISVCIRELPDSAEVAIDVLDTGAGIAAEHIPRLTERFYRVDRGRSRHSGGTGLGLAIVKHVMIRHEGRLAITSAVGKGSCFSLVFPRTRVAAV